MKNEEKLKYPIGKFSEPAFYTDVNLIGWIDDLRNFPQLLDPAISNLTKEQLNQNYRPGGWSVRQVVHHLANTHMIGLLRFKWALSESNSIIKAFPEGSWATFANYKLPVEMPLKLIYAVHAQWVGLWESFTESEWKRTYTNPESGATNSLEKALAVYAHHGLHHLAQINLLKK
jgi:uncharacterized damage-inducible protein DinB